MSCPILAYHRVISPPQYGIDVAPEIFESQLKWLSENNYKTITLSQMMSGSHSQPSVVITIDDGHKDTHDIAFPILKKYGFTATVFINTGLIGKKYWVGGRKPDPVVWHDTPPDDYDSNSDQWRIYEFMTWEDVKALHENGFDIQSHGVTHPFLTKIPTHSVKEELLHSKQELKSKLGIDAEFFCYPSGDHNESVMKEVEIANYKGAVVSVSHYDAIEKGIINNYALKRIGIWQDVPLWKFKMLMKGSYQRWSRILPKWIWRMGQTIYRSFRS